MTRFLLASLAALALVLTKQAAAQEDDIYEAVFDRRGVTGQITFEQTTAENVTIQVKLDGLGGKISGWHVHVLPGKDRDCGSTGGHYNPISGPTTGELTSKHGSFNSLTRVDEKFNDTELALSGPDSIVGRSIVLHKNDAINSRWVCATIRPKIARTDPYSERIAIASFTGEFDTTIKGTIMFRQFSDSNATQVLVDMRGGDTEAHKWHVHTAPADSRKDGAAGGICKSTGGHHDPDGFEQNSNYACDPLSPEGTCYIGDMAGKHGQLSLTAAGNSPMFYTDMNLPLFGSNSIVGLSITIHAENAGAPRVSCASIVDLQPIQMIANDFGSDMSGSISFSQRTVEYDPTFVRVDFYSLGRHSLGSWSIHTHPVPRSGTIDCLTKRCGISATGYQYNPIPGDAIYPVIAVTSKDQYEMGNLGGRWGELNVLQRSNNTITNRMYIDDNLLLAGKHSINGRSIVLRKNDDTKARIGCATIHNYEPERVVTAVFGKLSLVFKPDPSAQANETLSGTMEIEPAPWGPGVLITTSLRTSTVGGSSQHAMHIHISKVTASATAVSLCASANGHFDPSFKEIAPYSCDPLKPEECYSGDLTGKNAALLNISDITNTPMVMYDPLLNFADLVNRSIVIHAANKGSPRIACGTLTRAVSQPFVGVVRLSQSRRGTGMDSGTTVETILNRVDGGTSLEHKWHVHASAPGDDTNKGVCSSTGGHFDPFLAAGNLPYPSPLTAPNTFYEVGDLTGKLGTVDIVNGNKLGVIQHSQHLPLVGPYTIAGRSITFHAADGGAARVACAPLVEVCPIPYTLCVENKDCSTVLGGEESNWECIEASITKEATCTPISASCDKMLCSNKAVQSVFDTDVPVGHCQPSFSSHAAFDFSKAIKVGRQVIYQIPPAIVTPVEPTETPMPGQPTTAPTSKPTSGLMQALTDGAPVIIGVCALGVFFGMMIRSSRKAASERKKFGGAPQGLGARISARLSRRPPQQSAGNASVASTFYRRLTVKKAQRQSSTRGAVQHGGHAASSGRFSISEKLPQDGPLSKPSTYSMNVSDMSSDMRARKQQKNDIRNKKNNRISLAISEGSGSTSGSTAGPPNHMRGGQVGGSSSSASTFHSQASMNTGSAPRGAQRNGSGTSKGRGSMHQHVRGGQNGSRPHMKNVHTGASTSSSQSNFRNTGLLGRREDTRAPNGRKWPSESKASMASRASGAFRSMNNARNRAMSKKGREIDEFV